MYEQKREGLGAVFLRAVDDAMDRISKFRNTAVIAPGTPRDLGARAVFLKKFPYSIVFYAAEETTWIVAIAHQRRRPGYWSDRTGEAG